jgi:hypothetical protein
LARPYPKPFDPSNIERLDNRYVVKATISPLSLS